MATILFDECIVIAFLLTSLYWCMGTRLVMIFSFSILQKKLSKTPIVFENMHIKKDILLQHKLYTSISFTK